MRGAQHGSVEVVALDDGPANAGARQCYFFEVLALQREPLEAAAGAVGDEQGGGVAAVVHADAGFRSPVTSMARVTSVAAGLRVTVMRRAPAGVRSVRMWLLAG